MIQQQGQPEEVQKQDKKDEERNASSNREEDRKGQSKRRNSSNESYSNQSSSFENKIGKRYYPHSEFKIHFYVRHVHMNGMSTNEFLSFIKRKVNLAGSCDVVQIFNAQGSYCDVAIGMSNDDNAKLVYIGKKHFNFGRNGRQKEVVELSDAFKNYLENKNMLDKEHLERSLRRNQQSKGRSDSSESSRRQSRSVSKKQKKSKKADRKQSQGQGSRRRSPSSSGEPRKNKQVKKIRQSSRSSSLELNKDQLNVQPIKPQQVFTDKNSVYIFSIPQEVNENEVISEIVTHHKQNAPINHTWNTSDKMQYLELQFQDENTAQFLVNLRPCLQVKGIPLLVVAKKQRPVQDLLRNYEVQVELDRDVPPFNVYLEFKKYGDLIGIYIFQQNRNYLLLYSSSSQLQEALRPPVHLQLVINDQTVNANAKIIDKPIDTFNIQVQHYYPNYMTVSNDHISKKLQLISLALNRTTKIEKEKIKNEKPFNLIFKQYIYFHVAKEISQSPLSPYSIYLILIFNLWEFSYANQTSTYSIIEMENHLLQNIQEFIDYCHHIYTPSFSEYPLYSFYVILCHYSLRQITIYAYPYQ